MPKLTAEQKTTPNEMIAALQRLGVLMPREDTVAESLQGSPEVAARLAPALETVRQIVPDAALSLEMYTDPEVGETLLVVYARFSEYREATLQRLEQAQQAFEASFQGLTDFPLLTTDFKDSDATTTTRFRT
jgi:hypothetical protein